MTIPFFVPDLSSADIDGVVETLRSNWLTSGPKMREFERRFAEAIGAEYAVAVNSCTAALHLALVASGVGPGDEVIVPTLTFAATANVVEHAGARPVLVDVDPESLLVTADSIERALTPQTRAVIPVHYAGQACEMDPILELARDRDILVIEDAAHAFPAEYKGRPVGRLSSITCFSFYATKTITTGEGGMLVTNDRGVSERASQLRLHGLSRQAWERFQVPKAWDYDIAAPGFKYNMTDMAAAIGLGQLDRADEMWKKRQIQAELYRSLLEEVPGVEPLAVLGERRHAWHLFVVRVDSDVAGINRDDLIDRLHERGVGTSVHYRPLHLHSYYRDVLGYRAEDFPVSTAAFEQIISLPLYPGLDRSDVLEVVEHLADICRS